LRLAEGDKVHEILPRDNWDKGRAAAWLLETLGLSPATCYAIAIGDERTDEDMFVALREWGVGIAVGEPLPGTHARYQLEDDREVIRFLGMFLDRDAENDGGRT
jgi:trehalose-phosphatase